MGKLTRATKGKICDTSSLTPGSLLHMDFGFWDVPSHRGFMAVLVIIDAKTTHVWVFCTTSKEPPIHILRWFFVQLHLEGSQLAHVHVDEDRALARSSLFCTFIRDEANLGIDTTFGHASYMNGKVERPNRTLADNTRCMSYSSDRPPTNWC
jgi:hypothetical protein